jgi:hypothetical protein
MSLKDGAETAVRDIRRKTRKQYSAEEKIRIVLSGPRGEDSIADAVPPGRHRREPVLQLVEGVP